MKWLHRAGLLGGVALFAWVVVQVGPEHLWSEARTLGWGIALIVAVEGVGDLLHCCAWRLCFWPHYRRSPLQLWGAHLAGNAINFVTPTATLGGDVVRATLLPPHIPATEVAASLTINRLTETISDTSVTIAGVVMVLLLLPLPLTAQLGIAGAAAALSAGIIGFLFAQRSGRLASWLGPPPAGGAADGLRSRRARGTRCSRPRPPPGAITTPRTRAPSTASVALHVCALLTGALQIFIFLRLIDMPADLRTVATIFTVAKAVDMAAFFIPARLGAQEGGRVLAMQLVGIDASFGLLFSLVLRLEQLTWTAIGLAAYATLVASRGRRVKAVV